MPIFAPIPAIECNQVERDSVRSCLEYLEEKKCKQHKNKGGLHYVNSETEYDRMYETGGKS